MSRFLAILLPLLMAVAAFVFHYPKLNDRPMHTDEAVHAVKLGILMETGNYVYNPHEYHGPVIYYAALPFIAATGAHALAEIPDEKPLRLPIVLFAAVLVFTVACMARHIGISEAFFAAIVIGTSPAFSFYSRYYIQEIPFTLFCFLTLASTWKLLETGRFRWAIFTGLSLGATIALKETWIMVVGCAGFTAGLLHLTSGHRPWPNPFPWKHFLGRFAIALAVTLVTGLALLSNFFRNPAAIIDTFSAIAGYISRGVSGDSSTFGSNIHDHPWHYYLQLLTWPDVDGPWIWTEGGTLLLGVIGIISIIRRWMRETGPWHFIAIFTILLTAFYSAIPYKTPWNVLPLLTGWCLLAGRGFAAIIHAPRSPVIAVAAAVLLMAWPGALAIQSWRATITRPADPRNPYAYSPSSSNVIELMERAEQIAAIHPQKREMVIQIVSPGNDYWPLPWYLRRFPNIGYYTDFAGADPSSAIIISTMDADEQTAQRLAPRMTEFKGLRPDVILTVSVRQDLWDAFIAKQ